MRQRAGNLWEGLVEADLQTDLAEARLEHGIVAQAGVMGKALAHRQMHLAIVADVALGTNQHSRVVGHVEAVGVLFGHAPANVHVVLLRQLDEELGRISTGNLLGELRHHVHLVLAAELLHGNRADARQAFLGEHYHVDVLACGLLDEADHRIAIRGFVRRMRGHANTCKFNHFRFLSANGFSITPEALQAGWRRAFSRSTGRL